MNNVAPTEYNILAEAVGPVRSLTSLEFNEDRDPVSFSFYLQPELFPTIDRVAVLVQSMSVDLRCLRHKERRSESQQKETLSPAH
jgi:hypothetical protein